MPQAAVIAGIGAAAQIGGTIVMARGQSGAQKAQLKANQEALNYERQRQAEQQRRLQAYNDEYKKSWLDWYSRVGDEGLKRFGAPPVGIRIPGASQPAGRGGAVRMEGPAPSAGAAMPAPSPMPAAAPLAPAPGLGAPLVPSQPAAQPMNPQPQAPSAQGQGTQLGGWNDWTQYGA